MQDGTLRVEKVTPIESKQPLTAATHTISYTLDGFAITSVIETTTPIRQIVDRLKAVGATPNTSPTGEVFQPTKAAIAPTCPDHNTPMKASRKPGSWFCPRQADGGGYCPHKA